MVRQWWLPSNEGFCTLCILQNKISTRCAGKLSPVQFSPKEFFSSKRLNMGVMLHLFQDVIPPMFLDAVVTWPHLTVTINVSRVWVVSMLRHC